MKSTLHKFFLTLASVLLFELNASAQSNLDLTQFPDPSGIKFFLSVTGYSRPNTSGEVTPSTVSATVYDGYGFKVVLPTDGCEVGADKATVRAMMHNVASLGLSSSETRRHEVTVNTGVTGIYQKLGSGSGCWLKNCYSFPSATVPVTVVDYNHPETHTFTYAISKSGNTIIGTPSNFQDAHDAWYLITSKNGHVTSESNKSNDSYIGVKKNSYITLGNETFTFTDDVKLSEGGFSMTSMKNAITGGSLVRLAETDPAVKKEAVFFLPAGTCMAIGSSIATLNEDAKITIDFSSSGNAYNVNNILSKVKTAAETSSKDLIQEVLNLFDNLVGMVAYTRNVPITVQFGEPSEPFVKVYKGKSTPETELKTLDEFAEILAEYPNAVGLVENQYATAANVAACMDPEVKNIVIEYKSGSYSNYFYESPNFVFTDPTAYYKYDYYSPVNFIAVKGGYTRSFVYTNSTVCVPFDMHQTDLASGASLLTFAYYEPIFNSDGTYDELTAYAYFNKRSVINAGVPCFVFDATKAGFTVEFDNTYIVGQPDNSSNLQGTFVTSDAFAHTYFFGPGNDTEGEQLEKYTTSIMSVPFRSALSMKYDLEYNNGLNHKGNGGSVKSLKIAIIGENGEATTIDGVKLPSNKTAKNIYTINGVKVSDISKSGLYIVDGVKYYVK